ncbi:MAG: AMP-binding protein [Lachnospiraceae bacterium]|nr:AMP-binding protein [Lachnospiraceae bacterium]
MSDHNLVTFNFEDKNFLVDDKGNVVTYSDICNLTRRVEKVIPKRSLILLLCENSNDVIKSYLAFIANEVIPILISKDTSMEIVKDLINSYQPNFVLVPNDIVNLENLNSVVLSFDTCKLFRCNESMYPIYSELALLLPTSGSTGGLKLVRLSYENIKSNALAIKEYLKIDRDEKAILSLPMFYTYGLSIINSHFLAGATVYVTSKRIYDKAFWDFFDASKCTSFANVPHGYELIDKFKIFRKPHNSLRYLTQAGGHLPIDLQSKIAQFAKDNKIDFFVMYGQTEATARISYVNPKDVDSLLGSIGKPIPGGEMFLVNKEKKRISEPMRIGEIVYKGKNVALGYALSKTDLEIGDEWNNVLYTGDLGYFDIEGNFYVTGRKSRFVKMLGVRISLDDIERLIGKKFGIQCAVVGRDERLCIFIVDKEYVSKIKEYIFKNMNINKSFIQCSIIQKIPYNLNGKVDYKLLSEL